MAESQERVDRVDAVVYDLNFMFKDPEGMEELMKKWRKNLAESKLDGKDDEERKRKRNEGKKKKAGDEERDGDRMEKQDGDEKTKKAAIRTRKGLR